MIALEEVTNHIHCCRAGCDTDPDKSLVKLAKAGDVHAFELLMSQHRQRIYRAIFKITKNHEDSEDQVQETFMRAYRGLPQFREHSKFTSWLTRIALNQALMCLRRRRYSQVSLDHPISTARDSLRDDIYDSRPNPEQDYAHSEATENLRMELSRLPMSSRSVLVLRHLQEYTVEEAAIELGISVAAVKSRVLRARQSLRNRLRQKPDFP